MSKENDLKDYNIMEVLKNEVDNFFKSPEEQERISVIFNNIPGIDDYETSAVSMSYFNLKLILDVCRSIRKLKKYKKGDINNYISFSRFTKGYDKIFCDWCSISNGVFELFYDTVLEACNDKEIIKSLEISKNLKGLVVSFNVAHNEHYSPLTHTDEDLEPFMVNLNTLDLKKEEKIKIKSKIKYIIYSLKALKQIEQRWCPFKHMKKLKFNRDYYIYNSHNADEVKTATELLKKRGRVTLKNRPKKSPSTDLSYKEGPTAFSKFMEYIENIITI